jgi:2-(1,2-epoxy-1,2-dihydrophenyl)acetyl-CoA isomerase
MPYDTLTLESTGPVTVLTLNRPRQSNSLNGQLLLDLKNALDEVDQSGARCLLITGAGKAFCGGADLLSSQANPDGLSVGDGIAFAMDQRYHPVLRRLKELRVPTVAAVNGACAGGGVGVALACDIAVAARSAFFQLTFCPKLGLVPDLGSTWALPRAVGRARATALAMLGVRLPAAEAAATGLIWRCVDDAALRAESLEIAATLSRGPTLALTRTRQELDAALRRTFDEQLEAERTAQRLLGDRAELAEGVRAFAQKRAPDFSKL